MLAKHWIAENPGRFLLLTCRRIFLFWSLTPERLPLRSADPLFACLMLLPFAGLYLARRRRVHGAFLFLALVTFYPLIYYITFASPRYRHPIEPELLIFAVRERSGQPRETYQRCSRTSRTHSTPNGPRGPEGAFHQLRPAARPTAARWLGTAQCDQVFSL